MRIGLRCRRCRSARCLFRDFRVIFHWGKRASCVAGPVDATAILGSKRKTHPVPPAARPPISFWLAYRTDRHANPLSISILREDAGRQLRRTAAMRNKESHGNPGRTREIEQLSFDDAYRLWRQEQDSITGKRSPDGSYSVLVGSTDPETGEFTPSGMAALERRLGGEAHLRERFLREQLTIDAHVHRILEASARLCEKYGIASKAQVVETAEGRYSQRTTDGWSPQVQQRLWLEAFNGTRSQPDGPAPL